MSQPPYPYGNPQDPANQPPSDPFQTGLGYPPPFPDPAYPDPAYQQATQPGQYPPTQPYHPGQANYQPGQHPVYAPQPAYPDYPTNAAPPRRGATVAIVVVVALLVLVVAGGVAAAYLWPKNGTPSAQGSNSPAASNSPTQPISPTPASPTPAPGPTHSGDLRDFLVSAQNGSKKCPSEEGTDGKLTLDQAANLSDKPAQRAAEFQQYQFSTGAYKCWIGPDKTLVDIRLYQFQTTDGALGFFNTDIKNTAAGYAADHINDVSGVPGGKTFVGSSPGSDGNFTLISIGLRGDVVLVVALRQPPPAKSSVADQYLSQEYQKL